MFDIRQPNVTGAITPLSATKTIGLAGGLFVLNPIIAQFSTITNSLLVLVL
jgi:hypothetical protein